MNLVGLVGWDQRCRSRGGRECAWLVEAGFFTESQVSLKMGCCGRDLDRAEIID